MCVYIYICVYTSIYVCIHLYMCVYINICVYICVYIWFRYCCSIAKHNPAPHGIMSEHGGRVCGRVPGGAPNGIAVVLLNVAFTRDSFTSRLLCTNQPSFYSSRPPAWPTLVQYYCTSMTRYKTPLPTSRLYAIRRTMLVITISCKGQC